MVIHVTDADFNEKVLNSNKPVLVDFWAEWCGPCRMIAPIVEEIANNLSEHLIVAKLNVDESPTTASLYGISSIPTLVLFKDGKPLGKIVGFRPADQIESAIKGVLGI